MKNPELRYYMHDGPTAFRFELSGVLTAEGANMLEQDWRTASSVIGDRRLIVDMTFVTAVDRAAEDLLTRWLREGAQFVANSQASRELTASIVGPLPDSAAASDRTWQPFGAGLFASALSRPR